MIVVGGEALVDLVPLAAGAPAHAGAHSDPGAHTAPAHAALAPRLGGGPYNAALAAARLGAPTAFASRISTDQFGEALLARLAASGVRTELVQRGSEPTTLAVVTLDAHRHAHYTFYTEGTADRLMSDPGPLPEHTRILALGTLGMVLEPGASAYEAMLRRESARGVLTVLDPNVRPALIGDPDAYRTRFTSWLPHIGMLKLSAEDAEWLGHADPREVLAEGVRAVVLTDGAHGITAHTARLPAVRVPAAPARVVDTIGAGDTVLGALLAWLHRAGVADPGALAEAQWRAALHYAARAAAVTVSRSGAEPPIAAELES